jgi:hypothetical protein
MNIRLSLLSLLTLFSLSLIIGCKKNGESVVAEQLRKVSAIETVGSYKTPAGKPVRTFKITVGEKEYLLLVVGDTSAAVTMTDAITVKIGKTSGKLPFFAHPAGNAVFAIGAGNPTNVIMINSLGLSDTAAPPPSSPPGSMAPSPFPMEKFKAKIKGETVNLPELDAI